MDYMLKLLCEVVLFEAIVWLAVSLWVFVNHLAAMRKLNDMVDSFGRLGTAWYQDWFDSVFEETVETQEREVKPKGQPAASVVPTAVSRAGAVAPPEGPTRERTKDVFKRRTRA